MTFTASSTITLRYVKSGPVTPFPGFIMHVHDLSLCSCHAYHLQCISLPLLSTETFFKSWPNSNVSNAKNISPKMSSLILGSFSICFILITVHTEAIFFTCRSALISWELLSDLTIPARCLVRKFRTPLEKYALHEWMSDWRLISLVTHPFVESLYYRP